MKTVRSSLNNVSFSYSRNHHYLSFYYRYSPLAISNIEDRQLDISDGE